MMTRHIHVYVHTADSFEESKHPRGDGGKFAALHAAIAKHVTRLRGETEELAARKYKANTTRVHFEGDGPTKAESLSIGTINERKKRAKIMTRNAQIDALERVGRVAKSTPQVVVSQFDEARSVAEHMVKRDGWKFDEAFDVQLGKKFAGMEESSHGPGSVGRAIREALEPHIDELREKKSESKPTKAVAPVEGTPDDDWLKQLFGG